MNTHAARPVRLIRALLALAVAAFVWCAGVVVVISNTDDAGPAAPRQDVKITRAMQVTVP